MASSKSLKKILLIEDDSSLALIISKKISEMGYEPVHKSDGEDGLKEALTRQYSLIVCDLSLPKMSGYTVIRNLRTQDTHVPVIIVTNFSQSENEVLGYMNGANIFHKKPIRLDILAAQIKMLVERQTPHAVIQLGDLYIDQGKRLVRKKKRVIDLGNKEFEIMLVIAGSPGEVFTRRELIERTNLNADDEIEEGSIDTLISRIRKKLGTFKGKDVIETVYKQGYRLNIRYLD